MPQCAMSIHGSDGGDHAVSAADLPEIGHVEEQAHVSRAAELVDLDHARFENRPRCFDLLLERSDLVAGIAEVETYFQRISLSLFEVLGSEVALDFIPPQIAKPRTLLPSQLIGLALQGDKPLVYAPRLRLSARAVGTLRGKQRGGEQNECAGCQKWVVQR